MEKNFWGPKKCFSAILSPVTYSNPWSRQDRRKKLFGAPKVFFHDPVSVTYSNPWSHESRQNFLGPQKFFSTILSPSDIRTPGPTKADKTLWGPQSFFPRSCPRHIFEPMVPQKPTKLSGASKVLFHDPVLVTYSNPWSHKSRQNFPGPQKFFFARTHWDKHPPPNPTSRPW